MLAIGAALAGAASVIAVDVDAALAVARRNAATFSASPTRTSPTPTTAASARAARSHGPIEFVLADVASLPLASAPAARAPRRARAFRPHAAEDALPRAAGGRRGRGGRADRRARGGRGGRGGRAVAPAAPPPPPGRGAARRGGGAGGVGSRGRHGRCPLFGTRGAAPTPCCRRARAHARAARCTRCTSRARARSRAASAARRRATAVRCAQAYRFHRKESVDVEVDLLRFEKADDAPGRPRHAPRAAITAAAAADGGAARRRTGRIQRHRWRRPRAAARTRVALQRHRKCRMAFVVACVLVELRLGPGHSEYRTPGHWPTVQTHVPTPISSLHFASRSPSAFLSVHVSSGAGALDRFGHHRQKSGVASSVGRGALGDPETDESSAGLSCCIGL